MQQWWIYILVMYWGLYLVLSRYSLNVSILSTARESLLLKFRQTHKHIHTVLVLIVPLSFWNIHISLFESVVWALATVMVICLFALNPHFHPSLLCSAVGNWDSSNHIFQVSLKVVSNQFVLIGDPGEVFKVERKGQVNIFWFLHVFPLATEAREPRALNQAPVCEAHWVPVGNRPAWFQRL